MCVCVCVVDRKASVFWICMSGVVELVEMEVGFAAAFASFPSSSTAAALLLFTPDTNISDGT